MKTFTGTSDYILSEELKNSVNAAMTIGRPLLLKGEPGTGKTLLAQSIAKATGRKLIRWNVKSTTKAQDGLYVYDTVARLNDSRFGGGDVRDIKKYIKLGKMGEAFVSDEPVVLLIDEIDKADLEFPNDLLTELDEMRFHIPETNEDIIAKQRPMVVITSNSEKELPDAFLRRCVFHFIEFPNEQMMTEIVAVHQPDLEKKVAGLAIKKFFEIRRQPQLRKPPSTSELIDWIAAIVALGVDLKAMEKEIPYLGLLLKKDEDIKSAQTAGRFRH